MYDKYTPKKLSKEKPWIKDSVVVIDIMMFLNGVLPIRNIFKITYLERGFLHLVNICLYNYICWQQIKNGRSPWLLHRTFKGQCIVNKSIYFPIFSNGKISHRRIERFINISLITDLGDNSFLFIFIFL